jgi:hypothetical protein
MDEKRNRTQVNSDKLIKEISGKGLVMDDEVYDQASYVHSDYCVPSKHRTCESLQDAACARGRSNKLYQTITGAKFAKLLMQISGPSKN